MAQQLEQVKNTAPVEAPPRREKPPVEAPEPDKQNRNAEEEDQEPKTHKAKRYFSTHPMALLFSIMALAVLVVGGIFLWNYLNSYESTDDAQVDGHVNAVGTRIAGTIKAVYVEENQFVKAGQLLAEIDPSDYQVAVERARADVAQSQAQVQETAPQVPMTAVTTQSTAATSAAGVTEAQASVASAQSQQQAEIAALRQAEANNAKAQADVSRYEQLVAKDEISRQVYDQAVAAARASAAQVEAARANVTAAQKNIDQEMAKLSQSQTQAREARATAPQQVAIQRATVASRQAATQAAQAALNQAQLNLQYTKIYAPVDGIIGRRSAEVGTQVAPGQQLFSVVQTGEIWVTANYKETQLRRIRPGQGATIKVDALGRTFDGYVENLGAATGARFSLLPPENATGNYVKVVQRVPIRIRFKPGQDGLNRLRPGMSVESKVWLK